MSCTPRMAWGWVNHGLILIFGWTFPLITPIQPVGLGPPGGSRLGWILLGPTKCLPQQNGVVQHVCSPEHSPHQLSCITKLWKSLGSSTSCTWEWKAGGKVSTGSDWKVQGNINQLQSLTTCGGQRSASSGIQTMPQHTAQKFRN